MKPNIGITTFVGIQIARNHIPRNLDARSNVDSLVPNVTLKYSKSPFFFNKKTCLTVYCPITRPHQAIPLVCHSLHCWLKTGIYFFPSPFVATLCYAVTFIFLFIFIATYFLLWKIASSYFECEWILVIFFFFWWREMDISVV